MSLVLGVDPGASGALVALLDGRTPFAWLLMPTTKSGKSSRVNGAAVAAFLRAYPPDHAYVESVASRPGQGVSGMFTFGHAAGVVEGVLQACGVPYQLVTPQSWKRRVGLLGSEKDAARAMAVRRWPEWGELAAKGKGQALADAALIALAGDPTRVTT